MHIDHRSWKHQSQVTNFKFALYPTRLFQTLDFPAAFHPSCQVFNQMVVVSEPRNTSRRRVLYGG